MAFQWLAAVQRPACTLDIHKLQLIPLLQENIAAFDLDLDEDTLQQIDAIHLLQRNPCATD